MGRNTAYKRPVHRTLALRPVPQRFTHPFNMVRSLIADPDTQAAIDELQMAVLEATKPENRVKLRAPNRLAVTILSRQMIAHATNKSPDLQAIDSVSLKNSLRRGLPSTAARPLRGVSTAGLVVLGNTTDMGERSLAIDLESEDSNVEHHAAVETLNYIGDVALRPSTNPSHLSVARFYGHIGRGTLDRLAELVRPSVDLQDVRLPDHTSNWQ